MNLTTFESKSGGAKMGSELQRDADDVMKTLTRTVKTLKRMIEMENSSN
jgi:hypothetical protein